MEINRIRSAVLVVLMIQCLSLFTRGQAPVVSNTNAPVRERAELPASVPDPMEPVNRIM
jgi:hypothetical protein